MVPENRVSPILFVTFFIFGALAFLSSPYFYGEIVESLDDNSPLMRLMVAISGSSGIFFNAMIMVALALVLDRTVGIGRGFLWGLRMCWEYVPGPLKFLVVVTGCVSIVLDFNALVLWLIGEPSVPTDLEQTYFSFATLLSSVTLGFHATTANSFFLTLVGFSLMVGYTRAPAWKRIRFVPTSNDKTLSGTMAHVDDERHRKKIAKAEQMIEDGKLGRAARLLESLGEEYCYRAGKLYVQRGLDAKAAGAFLRGGDYYARIGNYLRAGNAYFFGGHWDKAVEAFGRMSPSKGFMEDRERVEQWGSRWGESLYHLGRFQESAELYLRFKMFKKAGESYEKAGMMKEAAAAYEKSGAHDATLKALENGGHRDLALLEKAQRMVDQKDFAQAASLFERGGDLESAASAYKEANLLRKAANCYFDLERYDLAVELYLEVGDEDRALNCYQEMGQFQRAAQLAAELGLQDRQAALFRQGGFFVHAARAHLMIGEHTQAVACMREVSPDNDEELEECSQILSILTEQGRLQEALACGNALIEGREREPKLIPIGLRVIAIYERLGDERNAAHQAFRLADAHPENEACVRMAVELGKRMNLQYQPKLPVTGPHSAPLEELVGAASAVDHATRPAPDLPKVPTPPRVARPAKPRPALAHQLRSGPPTGPTDDEAQTDITLTLDDESVYDLTRDGPLHRYRIIKELGKGGMGRVYKAVDSRLKRKVALKMLHPELNHEPKVLLFFKREVQSIASLNHSNIVQLYDAGMEKGCFYMVMEYVKGATLDRLALRQPDNLLRSMVAIWHQACQGLKFAHDNGIIHRDIKPTNIMVNKSRTVKILDFGLAKQVSDTNQTQQLWGTPTFMAPELFLGDRASFQTDIYSMGATFYVLATGEEPFDKGNASAKFAGHGLPEPPHSKNPKVPEALSDTILKCFHLDPNNRYKSVDELIARLRSIGPR
ncbi:Non-specific serine/threonine protein kinase [Sulfidibacter corallicola]